MSASSPATSGPRGDGSDEEDPTRTSPGGRNIFNDAMSPRPSQIALPSGDVDMNKLLRQKITSPTHLRRFDSADYFMERDFPTSDEEFHSPSPPNQRGQAAAAAGSDGNGGRGGGASASDVRAAFASLEDAGGDAPDLPQAVHMRHAPLTRKKPPHLETRWATHTTRPADVALNSPHPAGPRALKQSSIGDIFAHHGHDDGSGGGGGGSGAAGGSSSEAEAPPAADMNAVLRAKLAGKSRLRRFDSADYFLNHETGRLQQRGPPQGLHHAMSSPGRVNTRKGSAGGAGLSIDVSPIKSLAVATNVGSRSRGASPAAGAGAASATAAGDGDVNTQQPASARKATPVAAAVPSPMRLQRSQPRALQPGHKERYDARTQLRQRAELAARVPASPSDNLNVFFRKRFSPATARAMQQAGGGRGGASGGLNMRRSLASLSGSGPSTPQPKGAGGTGASNGGGGSGSSSAPASAARVRRNSRTMPASESLRTPADIRKAALHSRLNSQGKAL